MMEVSQIFSSLQRLFVKEVELKSLEFDEEYVYNAIQGPMVDNVNIDQECPPSSAKSDLHFRK